MSSRFSVLSYFSGLSDNVLRKSRFQNSGTISLFLRRVMCLRTVLSLHAPKRRGDDALELR